MIDCGVLELSMIHRPGLLDGRQDIGRILEAMLYYDRVHLMMSAQLFTSLWDELGPDNFYVLLDHPTITTTLTPEVLNMGASEPIGETRQKITLCKNSRRVCPESRALIFAYP
jgi:hypothetical protein